MGFGWQGHSTGMSPFGDCSSLGTQSGVSKREVRSATEGRAQQSTGRKLSRGAAMRTCGGRPRLLLGRSSSGFGRQRLVGAGDDERD